VLNKAGRVVLLPGDQVELKTAPTVSGAPADSFGGEPVYGPLAYDETNFYISNRLGVGTDTPAYEVDVAGYVRSEKLMCTSATPQMRWYESDAADDPSDYMRHEYGGNKYRMQWRDDSAGTWFNALVADGTNRFVGIGTTAPTKTLDVAGTGRFTGALTVGAYTLPPTDGAAGQVLATNGGGTLSWAAVIGPGASWSTTGNVGTAPGANYLGTADNQALQLHVNGQRALRVEPPGATSLGSSPNVIGGEASNFVDSPNGAHGSFIGGGGVQASPNIAYDSFCVVGGGVGNTAGWNDGNPESDLYAAVCGGAENTAAGAASFIGGGSLNHIDLNSYTGAIAGGYQNSITASTPFDSVCGFIGAGNGNHIDDSYDTVIGGGNGNTIDGSSLSFIGGGESNDAWPGSKWAMIGGGAYNSIGWAQDGGICDVIAGGTENTIPGGDYSAIGGGAGNSVVGSWSTIGGGAVNSVDGSHSTIPGGEVNVIEGNWSFAAGQAAQIAGNGAFVWADSTAGIAFPQPAAGLDEFWVRCTGGAWFITVDAGTGPGGYVGVVLAPGAPNWAATSDRSVKENFERIDCTWIAEQVAALPITEWNMRAQDDSIRHIGPMAQDFHAAFGLGTDERTINLTDLDGVALAAIQGLYEMIEERDARIAWQQAHIDNLLSRVEALERLVVGLE